MIKEYHARRRKWKAAPDAWRRIHKAAVGIIGRQIRKGWRHRGVELNRGWGFGYGVVEAVVEAIVGTTLVGTSGGAAVHDLVNCIGVVGVVKPLSCAVLFVGIGRGHSNSF
ncbi:hypothetical protein [Bradyrhizobium sp.]|uniref:hypothetical protein n=1 Tax=Bradyrhizobium sp. TaxID=376 RepID=UPI003C793F2D